MKKTRENLKDIFKNGYIPTQEDFADVFDSFYSILSDEISAGVMSVNGKKGNVVLTTSEIPIDPDYNFVTDQEKQILLNTANTSGINTGDQDLSHLVEKTTKVNNYPLSADIEIQISDIPNLLLELNSKQPSGDYATNLTVSAVSADLQNQLYTKQPSGDYAQRIHNHTLIDIYGIDVSGNGTKYLSDDGTYKTIVDPVVYYTNQTPTTSTVGGVDAGTVFNNTPITAIFDMLFYPYQAPYFQTFGFPVVQPLEVGESISGFKNFTWSIANSYNVSGGIQIKDYTNNITLASNISNNLTSINLDIGNITKTSALNHVWRISTYSSKGVNILKDFIVGWRWRVYYGNSFLAYLNENDIKNLTSVLTISFNNLYSFVPSGYKYIAYPSSQGLATNFKDSLTGLDVPFEPHYTLNITNIYGITTVYNVHRSTNQLGAAIDIIIS